MKSNIRKNPSAHSLSGFTLVELLVTISIIVVLAALIFFAIPRVGTAAGRANSTDNLHKLQLANGLYASDNNGRYVSTFTQDSDGKTGGLWDRNSDFLDLYVGVSRPTSGKSQESRVSPNYLDSIAYKARASGYDTLKASYGMVSKENYSSGNSDVDSGYRMAELTSPAQTAAFVTAVNWLVQYGGRFSWKGEEGKVNAPAIAYRHNGKALVAYYDGHVGEVSRKDIEGFDKRGGNDNSFWRGNNGTP
ncbi:prepilin-type N-terminal cleavage/methylation domain-containing protein [Akkermansiaceae bacterium]|nr:prepilin-type N-terminal cleavage/methylation domain-containing protein [Akkermansiaceae bacterium]